jgi:hypothetical protein
MSVLVELAFSIMNPMSCSDTTVILSTLRSSFLISIIYHFIKIKLDILIHRLNIIRNKFMNGLYILLSPHLSSPQNWLKCACTNTCSTHTNYFLLSFSKETN